MEAILNPERALPGLPAPLFRKPSASSALRVERQRRSTANWVTQIKRSWSRGPASVFHLARTVCLARRSLAYGQWEQLWRNEGLFSKTKANMLVKIGAAFATADEQISAHLPWAWNTLHCLARLGLERTKELIAQEIVHPGLTLTLARQLLAKYGITTSRRRLSQAQRRATQFAAFVKAEAPGWSEDERQSVHETIAPLLELLRPARLNLAA